MADDKRNSSNHSISMENREKLFVTGVLDVLSFDEEMIMAETDIGLLEIRGNDLHVVLLNLEDGELSIEGEMDSFIYLEPGKFSKSKGNFFSKLLK